MTDLSPAAQAVLDAYWTLADLLNREVSHDEMLAAALRAAADQVVPETNLPKYASFYEEAIQEACQDAREALLAIAAELEGGG